MKKIDGVKLIFPSVASDDRGNIWTSYLKNDLKTFPDNKIYTQIFSIEKECTERHSW